MQTSATARTIRLELPGEIREVLRGHAFDGLKALPKRGAEVGGVIVASGPESYTAEEFHLVSCEHLFGPSYHLSTADLSGLRDTLRECETAGRTPLAWFRSCTRPTMKVEREDEEIIALLFPAIPFVVLARPAQIGSARICVFARDGGDGWASAEEFEVAPSFRVLASPPPVEESVAEPALPPALLAQEAPPVHFYETSAPSRRPGWVIYAAAGVIAIAGIGAVWIARNRMESSAASSRVATAPARAQLGLTVRQENGLLHVSWNRDSAAVRSARDGSMEIADGPAGSSVPLPAADIALGSIVYTPRTPNVSFRLKIRQPGGVTSEEMVRVLGNGIVAPEEVASIPRAKEPSLTSRASIAPAPAAVPPATAPATAPATSPSTSSPATALPIPQQTSGSAAAPILRTVPIEAPAANPIASASLPPAVPQAEPAATLPKSPAPRPVPETPQPTPLIVVTPPVPLHQVSPSNRGVNSSIVPAPVTIGVLVSIDVKGRVTGAEPDAASRAKSPFLLSLALSAAREWRFKPATQAGTAVPGEHRIEFVFRPPADRVWRGLQ